MIAPEKPVDIDLNITHAIAFCVGMLSGIMLMLAFYVWSFWKSK